MSESNSNSEPEVFSDNDNKDTVCNNVETVPTNDNNIDFSQDDTHKNNDEMEEIPVDKVEPNENLAVSGNIVMNKNVDISEKVQSFKNWGLNAFMKTKQKVKEKLKRTSRTVDSNLEDKIDMLKGKKIQYGLMVNNNLRTIEQLRQLILVHQYSARMNAEMSQTEMVLTESFLSQSQIENAKIVLVKELIGKLVCSNETLETLVSKTFDDLMSTIQNYENARVEFDAYKTETVNLVNQLQQKGDASLSPNEQTRLQETKDNLEQRRQRYEIMKASLQVKIDLLEDHKNHVIQRELLNCRHIWFNFYSQCADLYTGLATSTNEPKDTEK